jgi:hypothetical protein
MKKAKRGFSWTCLFFGFWPALFRGDWKWAGIGALFAILGLFTLGLVSLSYAIVAGFKYNEWYLSGLYDRGFVEISGVSPQAIEAVTLAMAHGPLGWPIVWIALAFGALIASWGLAAARLVVPVALSSILYGCGYLLFSVSAELRYHLWTLLAALIAAVLAVGEAEVRGGRRIIWLFTPAVVAALAGIVARLVVGA